jgi:uncharacterized membrane-anchored protein YjiN (DUF445 family)
MVGGLADWFAVTALFRHPLGLPIPHTAIIAERKDQFGRTLGDFVQANFLTPEVVLERFRTARAIPRAGEWLADPIHAGRVAERVAELAVALADGISDEDLHRFVEQEVRRAIDAVPLAPLAGRALRTAAAREQELYDFVVPALRRFLAEHRAQLRARFASDSPWWLPDRAEARIFDRLFDGVGALLSDVQADPTHPMRRQLRERIAAFAERLETSPELRTRGEQIKHDVLERLDVEEWSSSLAVKLKGALREHAADPDSELRQRIAEVVVAAGRRLRDDSALQSRAEQLLEAGVRHVASQYKDDISSLVSATIARWDPKETAGKLELLLGRDLQFIRINGTVVGGLAGVAIHAVGQLIS